MKTSEKVDIELKVLLTITRSLPSIKGAGWLANKVKAFYNRKNRPPVIAEALGFDVELEPTECVDGALLFYPQIYDRREIAILKNALEEGDTFVDVGANIGIYSLIASRIVGNQGRVISIEADPYSSGKLRNNVSRNRINNIKIQQFGVSDRNETLSLHQQMTGNRGGSTFVGSGDGVKVDCRPLLEILDMENVSQVAALKIDIEGFEEKVLRAFFREANRSLYPRLIIAECNPAYVSDDQLVNFLIEIGYSLKKKSGLNHIWVLE